MDLAEGRTMGTTAGLSALSLCLLFRTQNGAQGCETAGSSRDLARTLFNDYSAHTGTSYHHSCPPDLWPRQRLEVGQRSKPMEARGLLPKQFSGYKHDLES